MNSWIKRHADKLTEFKLKLSAMKRVLWIVLLSSVITGAFGQKSIDELFKKYANTEGFVTVSVNGSLVKLADLFEHERDHDRLPGDISEIRILAQEKEDMKIDNFYDFVIKDLNLSDYEEFMSVKKKNQDLRMLVKTDGKRFKEFLLISGGEDNVLIQIKGNLSLDDAEKLSSDLKKDHDSRSLIGDLN